MKKILLALVALACAASFASAGVGILWSTQFGVYDHTVTPPLDGGTGAILDSYSVTWQLIYAGANNAIEAPDLSNGANGWVGTGAGADDDVWATRTLTLSGGYATAPEDSTVWNNWMNWDSGATIYEDLTWSTAGYVYQRIYEDTPDVGSWYFDSDLLALSTAYTGSPGLPQEFYPDTLSAGVQPDQQIAAVPEPATMSLLGLGALALAIRRRRA